MSGKYDAAISVLQGALETFRAIASNDAEMKQESIASGRSCERAVKLLELHNAFPNPEEKSDERPAAG